MGTASDGHDERFNQDISQTEKRYIGEWSPNMLADGCWSHIRETPTVENRDKVRIKCLINFYEHCSLFDTVYHVLELGTNILQF
jgi:hypothetical protein